jgi:hypothetical protein
MRIQQSAINGDSQHAGELRIAIILVVVIVALSAKGAVAQEPPGKCSQVKYSKRVTNAYSYRLKGVEGQAVYGEVSERGELWPASAVCVALFNQKDERFVTSVTTESGGQFKFATVAPGKYVLIVSVSELHEIIIPVEVADRPGPHPFKRWQLLLHLRSREDRKKSFVTPITQPILRAELLKMLREDQAIRNEIIKNGSTLHDLNRQTLDARMALLDSGNTTRVKEIVKRYGWPGPELVGADGTDAAFLLVQHSPDLALQKAMLPLVRRSFESGKLSASNYALLQDRVLTRAGKPQMYGTALEPWTGKEPVLYPIEDEANVDKRRAKIGLQPLREYLEFMKRLYFPQ